MCFTIMISTRVCNVLLPYYSKLIVDKLTEVTSLTDSESLNEVTRLVGVLMTLQMLFSSSGLLTQVRSLSGPLFPTLDTLKVIWRSLFSVFGQKLGGGNFKLSISDSKKYSLRNCPTGDRSSSSNHDLQPSFTSKIWMACETKNWRSSKSQWPWR